MRTLGKGQTGDAFNGQSCGDACPVGRICIFAGMLYSYRTLPSMDFAARLLVKYMQHIRVNLSLVMIVPSPSATPPKSEAIILYE